MAAAQDWATGQAGTQRAISAMDSTITAAMIQKRGRQPVQGSSHCTGKVEATMPSEPTMSIQELALSIWLGSYQRLKPVSGAIRQADKPMPMSTRAVNSPAKPLAIEKARQPATAKAMKLSTTRLGP